MATNTHGALIVFEDGASAFIDGVPDQCKHQWDGEYLNVVGKVGDDWFQEVWSDSEILRQGFDLSTEAGQNLFHETGYRLRGGMVSCSKCGKPFVPDMFEV